MKINWLPGNSIALLENGAEFFPALEEAIDNAKTEIFLETYIYANDDIGQRITAALCRAAARGVTVRLLVDGFGGREFVATQLDGLVAAGVKVLIYRREVAMLSIRRQRLRRLHRKLAVIDGCIGFVGGINIVSDFNQQDPGLQAPRQDYSVKLQGPLIEPVRQSVGRVWEIVSWASLRRRMRIVNSAHVCADPRGTVEAAFLVRDNFRNRHTIENAYLEAIGNAKKEIIIANAYFLPGRRFRRALLQAARRGVQITLLSQGWTDHPLQLWATRALYGKFLGQGVQIYEYHRSHLHAKVAIVDHQWATVGSSNIDPFSLLLAREANVFVRDAHFAQELGQRLQRAMDQGARHISSDMWEQLSYRQRFINWLAYGVVRLMIGIAGFGAHH